MGVLVSEKVIRLDIVMRDVQVFMEMINRSSNLRCNLHDTKENTASFIK